jgi:uncharacterized membrane protein YeaQ/YmgE (transglycosylase-associated protein family)
MVSGWFSAATARRIAAGIKFILPTTPARESRHVGCGQPGAIGRPASRRPGEPYLLERHMTFILWLVIGGILGWLASIVMKTNDQQGIILNVIVGIVGAFLGGLLLAPLFGTGTINQSDFSIGSLFVSFLGAVILLAIVNFFRGRRMRT